VPEYSPPTTNESLIDRERWRDRCVAAAAVAAARLHVEADPAARRSQHRDGEEGIPEARLTQGTAMARYVPRMKHRIVIAREQYKFSCAHMTVFPDGTKERLHGHNYTIAVALDVDTVELAAMIPFAPIKTALAELCAAWKEHVLLAAHNPHMQIIRDDSELEFRLCGDRYVLPRTDALLLPIDNISVEALAGHVAMLLKAKLAPIAGAHVRSLEVTVEESPGQGASCELALR